MCLIDLEGTNEYQNKMVKILIWHHIAIPYRIIATMYVVTCVCVCLLHCMKFYLKTRDIFIILLHKCHDACNLESACYVDTVGICFHSI